MIDEVTIPAAFEFDFDMCGGRAFVNRLDRAFEKIARGYFHFVCPLHHDSDITVGTRTIKRANMKQRPFDQSDVFAFLANPATHGLREPVTRIDTHGAAVFLAGGDVYKIKELCAFLSWIIRL